MSYDYKLNGWTEFALFLAKDYGDTTITSKDGVLDIFYDEPPEWAQRALNQDDPAALDAAWDAEQKRLASMPLLDKEGWSGDKEEGWFRHPGGYRLSLINGEWHAYAFPETLLCSSPHTKYCFKFCENHARELKGLPPL